MAKSKSDVVGMTCTKCKSRNYVTTRNKINMEEKLVIKKYCPKCKKSTEHKETTSLK